VCYNRPMVIGVCQITLHLPECHSLKEKRQIVKSIMARVHNQFEVAVAEVANNDLWQLATLGMSCVSNSSQHASEKLEHVRNYIEETRPDLIISNLETEILQW
jgi:uncharacterized protein YlxP (DUF503 family)